MNNSRRVNDLLSGSFATFYRFAKQQEPAWRRSSGYRRQISDSDQIVGGGSELEDPINQLHASMPGLTQQAHRFQPTKDLFNSFALPMANLVARMTRGAFINGAATAPPFVVLRDVRSHAT